MKSIDRSPRVTLLTGPRGAGKTSCVLKLTAALVRLGIDVFGVATPKIFSGEDMIGLAVRDLFSSKQIQLARYDDEPGLRQGPWRFSPEGIRFANNACDPFRRSGMAVIDEIGPLELRGQGFSTAFNALKAGDYPRALVVVRPDLTDEVARFIKGDVALIQWEPRCRELLMKHIERFMKPD